MNNENGERTVLFHCFCCEIFGSVLAGDRVGELEVDHVT